MHFFFSKLAQIYNSGLSRSMVLHGNIYDLFRTDDKTWVPLLTYLSGKFGKIDTVIPIIYELNGPIRMGSEERVRHAYIQWKSGCDPEQLILEAAAHPKSRKATVFQQYEDEFNNNLKKSIGQPAVALEFLKQLTMMSRECLRGYNLFIIIEGADMAMPAVEISRLSDAQYRRITIVQDWFSDQAFANGGDCVCLIAESKSLIHSRISRLPQLVGIEIPSPPQEVRKQFIYDTSDRLDNKVLCDEKGKNWDQYRLSQLTAGLSLQAIRQLLAWGFYKNSLSSNDIIAKVEEYVQSQVGEDVVEFSKPEHTLEDVIGNTDLKKFLHKELIPRFKMSGKKALPGAAVGGSIGSGKTFIFEAVAAELGLPVLVLKSIRSQWYGQTDVIFERLRRTLEALEKVIIFVDEADTQFGSVSQESHATERRLTGKIQAMMSDPRLRGKVIWLLMTARIHLLSPDIRRPGRVGDLIIPVLDPVGEDRTAFLNWMLGWREKEHTDAFAAIKAILPKKFSAAGFASLKSYIEAMELTKVDDILAAIKDHIPPHIGETRRYQELQALVNCTRKSLLPEKYRADDHRDKWLNEIQELELAGIH